MGGEDANDDDGGDLRTVQETMLLAPAVIASLTYAEVQEASAYAHRSHPPCQRPCLLSLSCVTQLDVKYVMRWVRRVKQRYAKQLRVALDLSYCCESERMKER